MRIQWSSNICLNSMLCSSHQFIILVYVLDRKKKVFFSSLSLSPPPCPSWFVPPCFALRLFSPPCKGGGAAMGWDFSLASWGRAGMGLDFLNPPHLASRCPSSPRPLSTLIKAIIISFSYPKILLFKQTYQY